MKWTSFLALLLSGLSWFSPSYAQPQPQRVTRLEVQELFFLGDERTYSITTDSVKVRIHRPLDEDWVDSVYTQPLTPQQRDWLLAPLDQTFLSRIKPNYEQPSTSDAHYFADFVIYKGKHVQSTRVWNVRVSFLHAFCLRINKLLPPFYAVEYPGLRFDN